MPLFIFILAVLALTILPSFWVQAVIKRYREPANRYARTGGQTARHLLDTLGLRNVVAEVTDGGDHYDPLAKAVRLTKDNFYGRSLTAVTIAAHEVGHAIQHQKAYTPFRLRSAMWPAVSFASNAWLILLMIGLFAQIAGLMTFAVVLYAVVVLFQLVTLPVEFDASRRAMSQLKELGLVTTGESQGARKVLTAAAMTYVAAALAALSQLAYWLIVINNRG